MSNYSVFYTSRSRAVHLDYQMVTPIFVAPFFKKSEVPRMCHKRFPRKAQISLFMA
jgi:hypothetical protein